MTPSTTQAEQAADQEIDNFNSWYLSKFTGDAPLTNHERAILKTFIVYKLDGSIDEWLSRSGPKPPDNKKTGG